MPSLSNFTHQALWLRTGFLLASLTLLTPVLLAGEGEPEADTVPTIKQVHELRRAGSPALSPDGSAVAYPTRSTDWEQNAQDSEIWLARKGEQPFQLTRTADDQSRAATWSPDGLWIAFLADRGEGNQVHLISPRGGEAQTLTQVEGGVEGFEWGPDGNSMILLIKDAETDTKKSERDLYGRFHLQDSYGPSSHLWYLDVKIARESSAGVEIDPTLPEPEQDPSSDTSDSEESVDAEEIGARRLTHGTFTVDSFDISSDGKAVVFSHRPTPVITDYVRSDISIVEVEPATLRPLVTRAGSDSSPIFSPDGSSVVFSTSNGETAFYKNSFLASISTSGGEVKILTGEHDGDPGLVDWVSTGIFFVDWQRTERKLFRLDPESLEIEPLKHLPRTVWSASLSADGSSLATFAQTVDDIGEIWRCGTDPDAPCSEVTDMAVQIEGWPIGERQIVNWKSKDGLPIEGVLYTPEDFDPSVKHPLLVLIHGGPSAVSIPSAVPGYVYPVVQWLAQGAVILSPNYRGSDGYGEAFRSANLNKLGFADAWDVLSGVDSLVAKGFVDSDRMGVMGWSQGGYISAFLATTSDRFRGISVGAGISNWITYYTSTDITPFTLHYLSDTPWNDPEIYAKTSPMTFLGQAETPTLIQHGENDRRVPTSNAYELYRGLKDVGVETHLFIYEDTGHGISRPKERLAAALHNWQWFQHTVWGEPLDLSLDTEEDSATDESEEADSGDD